MKFTSLENLQYFLSKLSYISKESGILNSIITSYLNDFKRDVVQIVSTLPNPGETGVLYLVPQGNNRFIEYYYNNNEYIQVGSSVFDSAVDAQLSNASKNPVQNKVILNALDTKLNASQLVNALNNTSSETPQSQVIYNLLNGKTSSEDFLSITNLDINSLFIDSLLEAGKLVCTGSTTWIIDDDGNLYCCGWNSDGQQGSGNNKNNVLTFTKRAENVKIVKATSGATWYLTNDDSLYGAGSNGAKNYDTTTFTLKMTNVDSYIIDDNRWVLTKDGELYGCGYNNYGELGSGNSGDGDGFGDWVLRKRAENVKSFFTGDGTTWYIDNNNDLYGCGNNNYNQQGLDVPVKTKYNAHAYTVFALDHYPVFQKRASNAKTVFADREFTFYLDFDGNLYGCGRNNFGQLGSTSSALGFIKRAENVETVKFGYNSTWYLSENGDLYGTGDNYHGQQGSGDTTNVKTFTKRAENVENFVISGATTFYLSDGNLYGCGNNNYGQLGLGDTTNRTTFTKTTY